MRAFLRHLFRPSEDQIAFETMIRRDEEERKQMQEVRERLARVRWQLRRLERERDNDESS